ncbi:MAG: zinc metallopeptidase [Clostridia bacterium]|nr:zinc metallopeptidase [Clostridia bacterium]
MFYYDWTMILLIPGILLTFWAQSRVKSAYSKYSRVNASCRMTGAQVAEHMLHSEGIYDVNIEVVSGNLTDHYDPSSRTLRLSQGVANSTSLAALGVAAHETGHALQHRDAYGPLVLRTAVVPTVNIGSNLSWPLVVLGMIFSWNPLIDIGILLFSLTVLFTLITLPVEFNASSRAMAALGNGGYLTGAELPGAKSVLNAAAMTYVAAAMNAILQLLRLIVMTGGRRRRD